MKAVTFQAPGEVRVEECPEPELLARDDAVVRVERHPKLFQPDAGGQAT